MTEQDEAPLHSARPNRCVVCCCCSPPPLQNLRVRRIYDEKNKSLLYVAYSTRFTGGERNVWARRAVGWRHAFDCALLCL
jgi:hypothetical protein